jgi:8-oxo-dGTP pyrophosphatase MutT (NUDIX family)
MNADLAAFLARQTPLAEGTTSWVSGTVPLRVTWYVGNELPPLEYVNSVHSLVLRGNSVLVLRNRDGSYHIVPGGMREPGESLEATLRREVLEETGWTIDAPRLLGCTHFHHLAPRPPAYVHPYPDFLWVVYVAEAAEHVPGAKLADDYEMEAVFRPIVDVGALALDAGQRLYLDAALKARRRRYYRYRRRA